MKDTSQGRQITQPVSKENAFTIAPIIAHRKVICQLFLVSEALDRERRISCSLDKNEHNYIPLVVGKNVKQIVSERGM